MTQDEAERVITAYEELQKLVYGKVKADPARYLKKRDAYIFGLTDWSELVLDAVDAGLSCYGSSWTNTTMSVEYFDFTIPWGELNA